MQNPILQLFGSYDLFGKAVPGAVLLFGIWTLFPEIPDTSFDPSKSLVNVAALLVILLLLGLMIGQGLHTLADNTEQLFRWIVSILAQIQKIIRIKFEKRGFELDHLKVSSSPEQEDLDPLEKTKREWRNGCVEWFRARFWGSYDTFAGHRHLFAKSIQWNFGPSGRDPFDGRWEQNSKDALFEPFATSYEDVFGDNIRQMNPEEVEQVYPHVINRIAGQRGGGHRQMQAIYSFCRSMWVVFLILTIAYSIVVFRLFMDINQNSRIFRLMPGGSETFVPLITLFLIVLFMDAAGTYKKHFVEYIVATFAATEGSDKSGETQDQHKLSQFRR